MTKAERDALVAHTQGYHLPIVASHAIYGLRDECNRLEELLAKRPTRTQYDFAMQDCQALLADVARLEAENARLREQVAALQEAASARCDLDED